MTVHCQSLDNTILAPFSVPILPRFSQIFPKIFPEITCKLEGRLLDRTPQTLIELCLISDNIH